MRVETGHSKGGATSEAAVSGGAAAKTAGPAGSGGKVTTSAGACSVATGVDAAGVTRFTADRRFTGAGARRTGGAAKAISRT
ncbi:MAG: hypothetical protein Tsb007_09110 [Rhizobacter sp.]